MPIGSTRLVDGYVYVKVADVPNVPYTVNWLPLHILEWERVHGPLPAGHCLWFTDGDRLHVDVANLELITRRELMARNTVHNLPAPLAEAVQLLGRAQPAGPKENPACRTTLTTCAPICSTPSRR